MRATTDEALDEEVEAHSPSLTAEQKVELMASWARDPAKFCAQVFRRPPREFQPALLRLIRDYPRVSISACRRAGKTALAAYIALWWLCTRPGSIVVTTAPIWRQVEKTIWREIRSLWADSIIPVIWPGWKCLTTEIQTHRVDWSAIGFASDSPDSLEGVHGGPTMLIFDESKLVSREVFESLQPMCSAEHPWRQVAISNPGAPVGWFYDTFYGKDSIYWKTVTIRSDQIPRLLPDFLRERDRLGEENQLFRRYHKAEFVGEERGQLIPIQVIEEAEDREMTRPAGVEWDAVLAVDPAGTGSDETVVCFRVGPVVRWMDAWEGWDEMATVGEIVKIWRSLVPPEGEGPRLIVDRPGLGSPIISRLREVGLPAEEFNPGARAPDPEQHANLKTAVAFGLRDRFFAGDIAIPSGLRGRERDRVLVGQLASYTVVPTSRGQDKIQDPEGDSPDRADALLIAFSADLLGGRVVSANVRGA